MDQFQISLTINILIGVLFLGGFIWFMYKRTNWFQPGGVAYEFLKARKEAKKATKNKNDLEK